MSDDDIETVHENTNGDQRTTKRVPYDGDVYAFEARDGEYEYTGSGDAPTGAVQRLQEHLGEDESTVADVSTKYTTDFSDGQEGDR